MKKLLPSLSALLVAASASAYSFVVDDIYYNILSNSTNVEVTFKDKNYASYSGDVVIPSTVTYDGVTYTVTSLGKYSLRNSAAMTSVSLPETLVSIEMAAFSKCDGLKKIVIPNSVTTIGNLSIQDLPNLEEVVFGTGVEKIGTGAFMGDVSVKHFDIPQKVSELTTNVFANCTSLTSITIPAAVTKYHGAAFQGCIQLTEYIVEEGNANYKAIDGVLYSKDLKTLVAYPGGRTDAEFTVPEGVTTLDFKSLGQRCITVAGYEFYNTVLKKINLPSSLVTIGNSAFQYLQAIEELSIPENVTTIGNQSFSYCTALKSLVFPDAVATIDQGAAYGCTALTSVEFGKGVVSIGKNAFASDKNIRKVTCKAVTPPACKTGVFDSDVTTAAILIVPTGSAEAYKNADIWKEFINVKEESFSGIETVIHDSEITQVAVYNVDGSRLNELQPGLNIVKMSDGTVRKVIVE